MRFDNEDVTTMRSLPRLVARAPIDKTVPVDVLRKGERKTLQVTVGRLSDEEEKVLEAGDKPAAAAQTQVLGLKLSALTDALRSKYGLDAGIKGALVDAVDPTESRRRQHQGGRRHRAGGRTSRSRRRRTSRGASKASRRAAASR